MSVAVHEIEVRLRGISFCGQPNCRKRQEGTVQRWNADAVFQAKQKILQQKTEP